MDFVYILAFVFVWSTSSPGMKVADGRLDARHLPAFFLESRGRGYVNFMLLVLSACVLALVVWGFTNMRWYWVPVGIIASIIVSGLAAPLINPVIMLYAGWIPAAGLTLFLWLR